MRDHKPDNQTIKQRASTPLRFVTAASLFDGHDAAINIMRRILLASGVEVIHMGHNRSVAEIVSAAIHEDANAIAISSYQGGHVEFLTYMVEMLAVNGAGHIRIFAGGGGVIIPAEKQQLESIGVARIYTPEDGQALGLQGMIDNMIALTSLEQAQHSPVSVHDHGNQPTGVLWQALAQRLTSIENADNSLAVGQAAQVTVKPSCAVLGITGTGGAGKSSLTDELILRLRMGLDENIRIALIAVDPTRRKTGGALLGDRIRMNAIDHPNVYMRSVATRDAQSELPDAITTMVDACQQEGFDLIIVETPGIGQGNAAIAQLVDCALYVMTPEFGAQSQLEKIDMLDFADVVAINKFDRKGAMDAYRDVCKQVQRNRGDFANDPSAMPVFGTIAARFNDDGMTALYQAIVLHLQQLDKLPFNNHWPQTEVRVSSDQRQLIPAQRSRYLAEIANTVRAYKATVKAQCQLVRERQQLQASQALLQQANGLDGALDDNLLSVFEAAIAQREQAIEPQCAALLNNWPQLQQQYRASHLPTAKVGGQPMALQRTTLSGNLINRVSLPSYQDAGEQLRWLMLDNVPGEFPYTGGVFAFKRENEDPTRMFAGEGDAFRTNRRFKALSAHAEAKRLSTAFDSVTLYGFDPAKRPDIYGKVGNSGVSIATLDDLKALYDGFDLCDPSTSVSMTINGPAPIILAMFLNAAIDQQLDKYRLEQQQEPTASLQNELRAKALQTVRGTVQADILKEDQGQNTCIFSTEFALKLMGDIQAYFIDHRIKHFYSVSISGYHIAEAGANPISQLAFTLANGFTYVEAYLARGMNIDDFAGNFSFFFSNGMCPEYTVMGRVARRLWAIAMRDRYGANARSQKLKYHIQTSGRSLHAQELDFNDIRTTLQALIAIYDNCNSLHTNAYDEAITTPTDESVRRALAIQLIINREWGLAMNENPNQGSHVIDELTELVEEAVCVEFERLSERGDVLGAMETGYQRSKIQDESMHYEHRKHSGSLPIVGVNTFINDQADHSAPDIELARSTTQEKQRQISRLAEFKERHAQHSQSALQALSKAAINDDNVFAELMSCVRHCSLGEITETLFAVGGKYRRNM